MLWIMVALLTKHFIVDFPLQPRWMYSVKGTLGAWGGIAHAGLHGAITWIVLTMFGVGAIGPVLAILEAIAHYFIDWAKMNLNTKMGWGPTTSEKFWWLLGLDQWLHQICYVLIVAVLSA